MSEPSSAPPKRLGSRKAVAALACVSTDTIKRAGKRGELTEYKFNRRLLRYDLDEVDRWILGASSKQLQPA